MWAKFITNLLLFVAFDLAVSAGIALFWSYEVALAFLLAIYIFRIALSIYDSIRLVLVFYFLGGKARSIKYFSILLTAANCPKAVTIYASQIDYLDHVQRDKEASIAARLAAAGMGSHLTTLMTLSFVSGFLQRLAFEEALDQYTHVRPLDESDEYETSG